MTEALIWIYNHTLAPMLVCAYFGFLISIPLVILHSLYECFLCNTSHDHTTESNFSNVNFPENSGVKASNCSNRSFSDMFNNITTYTTNPTYSGLPSNISYDRYRS